MAVSLRCSSSTGYALDPCLTHANCLTLSHRVFHFTRNSERFALTTYINNDCGGTCAFPALRTLRSVPKNAERFGPETHIQTQLTLCYLVYWPSSRKGRSNSCAVGLISTGG